MEEMAGHILDLARNSLEANATSLGIIINEAPDRDILEVIVRDNGDGIPREDLSRVMSPFFTSKDKYNGLGIALLQEAVERCEGELYIDSDHGKGTEVKAVFPYHHIDLPPLGKISEVVSVLLSSAGDLDLVYRHSYRGETFYFSTQEIKEHLQGVPLNVPAVLNWVEEYIREGINNLKGVCK